jgi:hypothetical protein
MTDALQAVLLGFARRPAPGCATLRSLCVASLLLVALGLPASTVAVAQRAPSERLVDRYRTARHQVLVRQIVEQGHRGVRPLPPADLPVASIPHLNERRASPSGASAEEPAFTVRKARRVRKLERSWFRETFGDVQWSFLGSGRSFSFVDTTLARNLRARLEAVYGAPTQTLGDFNLRTPREEYVQFEYWMVVNRTIPVVIMDAGGPMERGVIVSTDAQYREHLPAMRRQLLQPLKDARRAVYVDYYYNEVQRQWYRTGFNGRTFFRERVYRSQMTPGRRPWINPDAAETRSPRSP